MSSAPAPRRRVGRPVAEEPQEEVTSTEEVHNENGHAAEDAAPEVEASEAPVQPTRRPRTRVNNEDGADAEETAPPKPAPSGPAKRPTPKRVASARPEAAKAVARPTPLRKVPPPSGPAKKRLDVVEQMLTDVKEHVKGLTKEYLAKLKEDIDEAGGTGSDLYKSFVEVRDAVESVCTMSYGKDEILVGNEKFLAILEDPALSLGNKFTKVEKDIVETDDPITYDSFVSIVEDEEGNIVYMRKSSISALATLILQHNGTPVSKSNAKGAVVKQQHYKLNSQFTKYFTDAKRESTKSSSSKTTSTIDLNCISATGLAKLLLVYTYKYSQEEIRDQDRDLFDAIEKNVDSDSDLLLLARDGPKKIKKQQEAKAKKTAAQ